LDISAHLVHLDSSIFAVDTRCLSPDIHSRRCYEESG
jgi:hypothetical protein